LSVIARCYAVRVRLSKVALVTYHKRERRSPQSCQPAQRRRHRAVQLIVAQGKLSANAHNDRVGPAVSPRAQMRAFLIVNSLPPPPPARGTAPSTTHSHTHVSAVRLPMLSGIVPYTLMQHAYSDVLHTSSQRYTPRFHRKVDHRTTQDDTHTMEKPLESPAGEHDTPVQESSQGSLPDSWSFQPVVSFHVHLSEARYRSTSAARCNGAVGATQPTLTVNTCTTHRGPV
jgi:hypothetical protein